ncbi:30S ribosomal protein S18 [Candidatus Gracilibacteria bacterium]|nr:MAG: 30S ribosomal protein S18 [Candidatus Gracilibacteria bacterium]
MLQTKKKIKKVCPIEEAGITYIDYKDTAFLKQYLTKFNRIVPRKYSGTSLRNQKKLARAIKRARYMALLPYIIDPRMYTETASPVEDAAPVKKPEIDPEGVSV